jgi:hypothetical protein
MGEIKSTLDLVLEKTKNLSLSTAEKEEMNANEAFKKVSGYISRYRDGVLSLAAMVKEIEGFAPKIRQRVHRETARQMCSALDLSPDSDSLVTALEVLAEPAWAEALEEVKRCRTETRKGLEAARRRIEEDILAALAGSGIRGSAVVAKPEGDREWVVTGAALRRPCEERIEALRQALAA